MSYPEAIQYLESFVNYEHISSYPYKKCLKLERIKGFLNLIGNPEKSLRCVHIAGTKGKGSTCAFLAYILREAGFKTGLYTSPHLIDFRERIRILSPRTGLKTAKPDFEGMISKPKFAGLINRLKPVIQKYNRSSIYGPLTFFEACTAVAFVYFKQENVDFAVLETGLGGRLDATNVVIPMVCVITPISYEHTDKLGCTLRKIALEKSGIIKQGLTVISAPQDKEAQRVIRDRCKAMQACLHEIGKRSYCDLRIKLYGRHQLINAAVAQAAIRAMRFKGVKIGVDDIKKGLYNTLWPGRCEVISRKPLILLDGAHNVASIKVLKQAIKENFQQSRLILIFGISNDKDIQGIAGELYSLADAVILTKTDNPRALEPEDMRKYFLGKGRGIGREVYITKNVKEAKNLALRISRRQDLILVTGSLYLVGEFRSDKTQFN